MYDYKKIRKWLIIIPFIVIHIFGSQNKISDLFLNNSLYKISVPTNFFGSLSSLCEEDSCKSEFRLDKNDSYVEASFTEGSCNNFFKNFIDKFKKPKKLSKDIIICDNRIDCIDKKFSEIIYSDNPDMQERNPVVFA